MAALTLGMTPKAIEKATGIRLRYLDNLVNLHCAPDLLALGLFPDIKEVTESFAAYRVVLDHLAKRGFAPGDASIVAVFPGDGTAPRTGATFAFRTAWQCHSIDPRMKVSWLEGQRKADKVARLRSYRSRVEHMPVIEAGDRAVVVAVHSHARLAEAVAMVEAREVAVIAIECCVRQELEREPDLSYRDRGVLSPCNRVDVWFDARAGGS